MAEILDYIAHQVENLKESVKDNSLLKKTGIYELTMYLSRNPELLFGGYDKPPTSTSSGTPSGGGMGYTPVGSVRNKVSAKYGISVEFLKYARDEANKEPKNKVSVFKNILLPTDKDRDVRELITKLFNYKTDELFKAFVNAINYVVLNKFNQISDDSRTFEKEYCNLTYASLPYGKIAPMPYNGTDKSFSVIEDNQLMYMLLNYAPVDLSDNPGVDTILKYYQAIYNQNKKYIRFDYLQTGAIGYLKNDTTHFNVSSDLTCSPLSLDNTSPINIGKGTSNDNVCSSKELNEIEQRAELVENLSNNSDFEKIEGITGLKLYQAVNNFARLSANFDDNTDGENSINIKLYFSKENDVFATVRSNDLKLAVGFANFGNESDGLLDLYFNPKTEELYFVNGNKEQFGYCKGLYRTEMSNCEHTIYAQLLQPSLSITEINTLFQEHNILPIVLDENIVKATDGLEEAQRRQSYLLALNDDRLFYDLFMRNIASYVYSYAVQVEKKSIDGKGIEKTGLAWIPLPNPKWSNDSETDTFDKKKYRWENPNIFYIYDVRENFWTINQQMSIKEVLAYFVSKGGSRENNSKYYRKLCQRILGVDYYVFSQKLTPFLLDEGLLCISELEFDMSTNALIQSKYQYKYDYIKDDVYKKSEALKNELEPHIKLLYGEIKGAQIIDFQLSILEKSKPDLVKFGNKEKNKNLTLSVHNPIFFNELRERSYVGRYAQTTGIFRDGKINISTKQKEDEKYKPLQIDSSLSLSHQNYKIDEDGALRNNHIGRFIEWIKFSKESKISKEYISQEELIVAYVLPQKAKDFIPNFLMPKWSYKSTKGRTLKLPLAFRPGGTYKQQVFTMSNIFNTRTDKTRLTKESVDNLVKSGIVEKRPKVNAYTETILDAKGNPKIITHKINPITLEEGKKIYDLLMGQYNKLESEIKIEGNRLFTLFCQTQLTGGYKVDIEQSWNSTYNNMAIPEYSKFPVFCEHSRWFGSYKRGKDPFLFNLREAQLEGLKFSIANSNSGLLAHEVGFGKTTTSIALISHMNLTGEAPRNLVFTPKQVYEKFDDEITGNEEAGVLGLIGNYKHPYSVVKMGNARKGILMGDLKEVSKGSGIYEQVNVNSLKTYNNDEIDFIQEFKQIIDDARYQMANTKVTPQGHPRFFVEPELINETDAKTRIPLRVRDSSARNWWGQFNGELITKYEIAHLPAIQELLDLVDVEISRNEDIIESQIYKYMTKNLYTRDMFVDKKNKLVSDFSKLPKYIQKWWRSKSKKLPKIPGTNKVDYGALKQYDYPNKFWVEDIDGAVELGIITSAEGKTYTNQKGSNPYPGTLTPEGLRKILELDERVSNSFFNKPEGKRLGRVVTLLNAVRDMLVDELGVYRGFVSKPNTIVLCHHGAIPRFRVSQLSRNQAKNYVSNTDDIKYVSNNVDSKYDNLALNPLSLTNLDITGIVVDEIHNFNNLIGKPRNSTLSLVNDKPSGYSDKHFTLLPTEKANALLSSLPDGSSVNQSGVDDSSPYDIRFNSTGKGTLKVSPTNLISMIFEIQNTAKIKGISEKNTIMMSATPFTDNVFQMFTVFGMTNIERLKESHMDKAWDFFITFVKEEWRYNLTHKNQFGLFSEIEGYYNTFAMSNFIKSFANFKVSDAVIEKSRPIKYLIPQSEDAKVGKNKIKGGANTSSLNWSDDLTEVSSYVDLSDVQKTIIKKISEFVEGKIDTPYAICPNYQEFSKTESGDIVFQDEETQEIIKNINTLTTQAKKEIKKGEIAESDVLLEQAYDLAAELFFENQNSPIIQKIYIKVDELINGPEEEGKTKTSYEIDLNDLGLIALDEDQVFNARAIVGQSYGQACVISPYLLKCDSEGQLENDLLKNHPLVNYKTRKKYIDKKGKQRFEVQIDKKKLSLTAKNFVEQSPKIKYAVDCVINSIKYDEGNISNNKEVGGQIIYLDRGKNFKYGGNTYNAYILIKQYLLDTAPNLIEEEEIAIITGNMGNKGSREEIRDRFNGISNKPTVKVLIGSSAIKEGIDLHKRAHTLYILDSDFSPSNAMQLEGRIWRQGNMWKNVRIVYVLGRDSIDAFVYSKLQQKINEIKKMLEQGVYEMNKTQFTINAKERIKKIISDVDQLTKLEWQDHQDSLLLKLSEYGSHKSSLQEIKQEYRPIKKDFESYIVLVNKLYQVVISNEKTLLAKAIKTDYDILRENKYRIKSAEEGTKWRKANPYIPMSMAEAVTILDSEIKNKEREFDLPELLLDKDSGMTEANQIISKVVRVIMSSKGILQKLASTEYLRESTLDAISKKTNEEKVVTDKLIEALWSINDWSNYDHILKSVSAFEQGSPNERIMSNYSLLISDNKKPGGNGEFYSFEDISDLIVNLENKISKIRQQLSSKGEGAFKLSKAKEIEKELIDTKKVVGESNEVLIEKFENSMKLLKLRK